MKKFSDFLKERCWTGFKSVPGKKPYSPGSCVKESAAAAIAAATAISKKKSGNYDEKGFRKTSYKNPDHPNRKSNTEREAELKEDLRKWFSKTDPAGDWKRINSKGEAIGPCAREPGEPKPKCMSRAKRESLTKKERASAVASKRKHDPNPERQGKPINVSNFGKGKISEDMENLDEKNVPTSPEKWAQAKAQAKAKFDVYPSAYANGWAAKKYKAMGGSWKSVSEAVKDKYDEGEYDQEGDMAKSDLRSIIANAKKMHDMIKDDDNLPEWVQSKITKAEDYISTVANYMAAEMSEEVEQIEELSNKTLYSYLRKTGAVRSSTEVHPRNTSNVPHDLQYQAQDSAKSRINARKGNGSVAPKGYAKEEVELDEADQKFIDSLNKLAKTHKVGDSVTVDSKFFGKQKGKVVKMDNQSVHVQRNGKKYSEKYPHDSVTKEEVQLEDAIGLAKPKTGLTAAAKTLAPQTRVAEASKPPFDKPYTTIKGTVTDKSGAKHTPMSRARDIARMAMKKQIEKMKQPVKESLDESRRMEIVREAMKVAKKKKETMAADDKYQPDPMLSSQITKT